MFFPQFVAGLWLGLWFVGGNALWSGGVFILSLQYYEWLVKGFWQPVSLQSAFTSFGLPKVALPLPALQQTVDELLLLPASPVFILIGMIVTAAAKFGRNNIERRASHAAPRTVNCEHRRALHEIGITTLHIHESARR